MADVFLVNPGEYIKKWNIVSILFEKAKWTKEAAEQWVKRRYRYYKFVGEPADKYFEFRVIPETKLKELEKMSAELRPGGKPGFRIIPFSPPKGIWAMVLVVAPPRSPVSEQEEIKEVSDMNVVENPRKVTKEIAERIIQLGAKGYKNSQIRGIIKEEFDVELSPATVRNVLKGIQHAGEISDIGGVAMPPKLDPKIMKAAMEKFKNGEFKSKSEALKWAWRQQKGGGSVSEQVGTARVAAEILENKGKSKGGRVMAKRSKTKTKVVTKTVQTVPKGLTAALNRMSKAIEGLTAKKKKSKSRSRSVSTSELAKMIAEIAAKEPGRWKPFTKEMGSEIKAALSRVWEGAEARRLKEILRERVAPLLKKIWSTPEGIKFREILSRAVKSARAAVYPAEASGISDSELTDIAADVAVIEMLDDIGAEIGEWKPFTKEMGLREALQRAWASPAGEAMKAAIRAAWATPESYELRKLLSEAVKSARAKIYPTGDIGDFAYAIAESIEAREPGKWKPFTTGMGLSRVLREAWETPEGRALKSVLQAEVAPELKAIWSTPEAQVVRRQLAEAIKKVRAKYYPAEASALAALEALEDIGQIPLARMFALDWIIPGGVGIFGAGWLHWLMRRIVKIPFGEEADTITWRRILYNVLAGALHYSGANFLFNQFARGVDFFNKLRVAYSIKIYNDTLDAIAGGFIPSPAREELGIIKNLLEENKIEEAKKLLGIGTSPTEGIGSEISQGGQEEFETVVDVNRLEVDAEGNLVVPPDYYEELRKPQVTITSEEMGSSVEEPHEALEEEESPEEYVELEELSEEEEEIPFEQGEEETVEFE